MRPKTRECSRTSARRGEGASISPLPDFLEREFEIWDLLRSELPVARTGSAPMAQGVTGGWVVTRYDDVADVLRRPEDFSSQIGLYPVRAWIPQAIDPPAHTGYRRLLEPVVHGRGDGEARAAPRAVRERADRRDAREGRVRLRRRLRRPVPDRDLLRAGRLPRGRPPADHGLEEHADARERRALARPRAGAREGARARDRRRPDPGAVLPDPRDRGPRDLRLPEEADRGAPHAARGRPDHEAARTRSTRASARSRRRSSRTRCSSSSWPGSTRWPRCSG